MGVAGMQGLAHGCNICCCCGCYVFAGMGRLSLPCNIRLEMVQRYGNGIPCLLGRSVHAVFPALHCNHPGNTADY